MKFKKVVVLVVLALLLALPVLAEDVDVVARVGNQEITESQLDQMANTQQLVMQIAQTDQSFAQLLSDTEAGQEVFNEYRKLKLDELIDVVVLEIEAEKRGIGLTQSEKEEAFNDYIQQLKNQNDLSDEELLNILNQQGIESLEQYKEVFLANSNLAINKLIEEEIIGNVSVSDEEAEEIYNSNQEQFDVSFEELKEEIKNNVLMQKQQIALNEFVENAKSSTEIEIYL